MPLSLSEQLRGVCLPFILHSHRAIARWSFASAIALAVVGCAAPAPTPETPSTSDAETSAPTSEPTTSGTSTQLSAAPDPFALVTEVEVSTQSPGNYTFAVTLASPDTGCEQYANWWEVVTEEGDLVYRRILAHSHIEEQPFQRSGGPVELQPDQTVIVRGHMDPDGYGTQAMQGSVEAGFTEVMLPEGFAADLAEAEPQPSGCTF
ncbi:MAG: hypothetical protein AAF766_25105 [Cyanobacteria bacterium P01_D01_bin.14]